MSYSTDLPGLDEARLLAIQTLITNSLTDLNSALDRDALTPIVFSADQIVLGDPMRLTASRISIIGGGEQDGTDINSSRYFTPHNDTQGMREEVSTNIFVYIHPDEFPDTNAETQATTRELAVARICDHLRRRVFNDPDNIDITLTSREHSTDPDYDALLNCRIKSVRKGITLKDFGGLIEVPSAHLIHVGELA